MTRWLNAREWLEHERLTGLPHADFADEALRDLDMLETGDGLAKLIDDALSSPEDLVGAVNELCSFYDVVLEVLTAAGVVEDDCTSDQVGDLLRMFLPAA